MDNHMNNRADNRMYQRADKDVRKGRKNFRFILPTRKNCLHLQARIPDDGVERIVLT